MGALQARSDIEGPRWPGPLRQVGMLKEGVLRLHRVERGEAIDEAWYGILRSEWTARTEPTGKR